MSQLRRLFMMATSFQMAQCYWLTSSMMSSSRLADTTLSLFPKGICFETSVSGMPQQNSNQRDSYKGSRKDRLTPSLWSSALEEGQPPSSGNRWSVVLIRRNRICTGRDVANQLAPAMLMILLWAFEIVPIEGEIRPDPRNPQFLDSLIA